MIRAFESVTYGSSGGGGVICYCAHYDKKQRIRAVGE